MENSRPNALRSKSMNLKMIKVSVVRAQEFWEEWLETSEG